MFNALDNHCYILYISVTKYLTIFCNLILLPVSVHLPLCYSRIRPVVGCELNGRLYQNGTITRYQEVSCPPNCVVVRPCPRGDRRCRRLNRRCRRMRSLCRRRCLRSRCVNGEWIRTRATGRYVCLSGLLAFSRSCSKIFAGRRDS